MTLKPKTTKAGHHVAGLPSPTSYSTIWLTIALLHAMTPFMSTTLDTTFAALADSTRRTILTMLLEDDMAVTDVAEPFEMSLAAISKHLMILSRAGLITQEKRGRVKWCKLEPEAMREGIVWIESFGQLEALNFDAFEQFLNKELES
jgi:DNA-binding transcriptional ArsR family regulator